MIVKILTAIDNQGYKSKPKGAEIGTIRNKLAGKAAHHEVTIEQLAGLIAHGHTIQGALLEDKTSPEDPRDTDERFIAQQAFIIDIDNKYKDKATGRELKTPRAIESPEEIKAIAAGAGLQPCIIAESFTSGTADDNGQPLKKYHAVFAADKPIKDVKQSRRILNGLINLYNRGEQDKPPADRACKDPARIIFGTTPNKFIDVNSVVNSTETLLNCFPEPAEPEPEELPREPERPEPAPSSQPAEPRSSLGTWNDKYKNVEAEPDVLLQMIDTNTLSYEEFCKVTGSFKAAGGSRDIWEVWADSYQTDKHTHAEVMKANRQTFEKMNGKRQTIGTLKKYCEKYAPDTYKAYIAELAAETQTERKKRGRKPKAAQAPTENSTQSQTEPQSQGGRVPLEYPRGKQKPQNYVDFAFRDHNNKIVIVPQYLAENVRRTCKYIFVKGSDPAEQVRRFWYSKGVYIPIPDEYIKNELRKRIEVFGKELAKKSSIEEAFYHLTIDNVFHSDTELNSDENIINFKNGLLKLDTLELIPHTPDYYSTIQIPCNYNPSLSLDNAPVFNRFITHLANNDKDSKQALIEFIGAAISNVNAAHYKKALFLQGAGNCGKTQYINFCSTLISDRYFSSTSLEDLEGRFGTYILYGKRLAGDPDIKFMKVGELNKFKQATGGDPLRAEPKGKQAFTFRYNGFMLFGCNRLPLFGGDRGQWVYDRMLLINCGDPVPRAEQDPNLQDKLKAESEAIVSAAIAALKQSIENGYTFTTSESSKELLRAYKLENDIVHQFLSECCERRSRGYGGRADSVTKQVLFETFREWAHNGNYPKIPNAKEFKNSLFEYAAEYFPDIKKLEQVESKSNGKYYFIFTLTPEAKKEYGRFDSVPQEN